MRASILSAENRADGAPEMPFSVRQQVSNIVRPSRSESDVLNGAVTGAAFR